ncbi:NF-kappa-B inhibitor-interacting Ras-like protein 1 [Anneissia japonica]|uniref:NF-kappa-B inhibitor-interacting Ras-like protein 1 n=1 Tax=Anneissia japonica TaxID=1529436 RepID=UPI0014255E27|nr:NF-kappa-B inhibitor-interacting Ras-like protein 1 [Anneissia japonica]XP_033101968.1 NF-kappa-B inhibitor-interacting Ras-like protein 1 [Anneissia japonica]
MGKTCKIVVCGGASVGKTSLLQQALYGKVETPPFQTIEDIHVAVIDTDRGVKEKVRFYDTKGLNPSTNQELPKHYISMADGFILVFSLGNLDSFHQIEQLRKSISKTRDFKDKVCMVALGNKSDLVEERQVSAESVKAWEKKQKNVRTYEVSSTDRNSLAEPLIYLTSRLTQPPAKSSFLSGGKKSKSVEP